MMSIQFNIHCETIVSESLVVILHHSDGTTQRVMMTCNDNFMWTATVNMDAHYSPVLYQYAVLKTDTSLVLEYAGIREVHVPISTNKVFIYDNWRASYGEIPFMSTAFSECFFKRTNSTVRQHPSKGSVLLQLHCPQVEPNRHIAIIGNQQALGNWDVSHKVKLDDTHYPTWNMPLDSSNITFSLEYKYLLVDSLTDEVLAWDGGPNRLLKKAYKQALTVVNDEHFIRTIPSWKGAGVAIPVFSLRSKEGFGIGEFNDLIQLVDWAKRTGQRIIQILPVNDTISSHTNQDSYPYNAISAFALHPIYLHLDSVGKLKTQQQRDYFESKKQELNGKSFADYQHVMDVKWEYLNAVYPHESPAVFASDEYKTFFEANKEWLVPYAAFSYLRDVNGTPEFATWSSFSQYDKAEITALTSKDTPHYTNIAFFYFLQYHLHKQLVEVHDYARTHGIVIKGDIPIGTSPHSVDVWVDPKLFNTNVQAGVPPDDFSTTGQNWGFPTYNWSKMAKDGYQWWQKRFRKLSEYVEAYRIDHILGFFRIWEIPVDAVWGLLGSFHPALPFTPDELETKGLHWDENRFLTLYLKEHVLHDTFGEYTDEVIREYLMQDGQDGYKFKPEYDTQKKIETYFASLASDVGQKEALIRDGLLLMHCEVIFVRDLRDASKFHPRIAMQHSATFCDLPAETRSLLDRIYVDYFYHRHTEFWKQQALKKLPPLISSTNMLVCGEDLGMIPDSVPDVMNALEIISLEIQRMPKKPNTEFALPNDAPYRSVCTTGTHDMNPLRAWWEEDATVSQRFYNQVMGMHGSAPLECKSEIIERIIQQHLDANAMLVILPWQDWIALDERLRHEHPFSERINVPSNPRNFWSYRMHITLEQLLKEDGFNDKVKEMILHAGR